jgi:hypothetical protein
MRKTANTNISNHRTINRTETQQRGTQKVNVLSYNRKTILFFNHENYKGIIDFEKLSDVKDISANFLLKVRLTKTNRASEERRNHLSPKKIKKAITRP